MTDSYLLGQQGERLIGMTGWIGADPQGRDVAFLLIYPTGDDITARMRTLAGRYGLTPVTEAMPTVPVDVAHVTIDTERVVRVHPGDIPLNRPVTAEWTDIAQGRGEVVLTVGERRFDPDRRHPIRTIDRYTADPHGLHAGLIRVA